MHYCFQNKDGALLYLGEGKRYTTVYRRRDLVLYCSQEKLVNCCFQEKETGASMFQEKGSGAILFSGEENMFSIVFRRREHVHYCYQEKETGALMFQEKGPSAILFSGEINW